MTVLQKAINEIRDKIKREQELDISIFSSGLVYAYSQVVANLESLLPEEEAQIRGAFRTGMDWVQKPKGFGAPDLETYITNLKK